MNEIGSHTHTQTNTYKYIYTYKPIYIYTYLHIYLSTYIHIYIYTYLHMHVSTYIYIYIYTYIHTYIYIYMYTHIPVYLYTYIYKHLYTYIHMYICTFIQFIHLYIYIYIYIYEYVYTHTYRHTPAGPFNLNALPRLPPGPLPEGACCHSTGSPGRAMPHLPHERMRMPSSDWSEGFDQEIHLRTSCPCQTTPPPASCLYSLIQPIHFVRRGPSGRSAGNSTASSAPAALQKSPSCG